MAKTLGRLFEEVVKIIDVTPNEIRVRVRQPEEFTRLRSTTFDAGQGITALIGPLESDPGGGTEVQSLRFKRAKGWTPVSAERWARNHGYTPK